MSIRPKIQCPHCSVVFDAQKLVANRKHRNEFGIDVFGCPECSKAIKIEPREYMFVSQQLNKGEMSEGVAILAVAEHEVLPSEQMVIDEGGVVSKKTGCLKVIVSVGIGVITILYLAHYAGQLS